MHAHTYKHGYTKERDIKVIKNMQIKTASKAKNWEIVIFHNTIDIRKLNSAFYISFCLNNNIKRRTKG